MKLIDILVEHLEEWPTINEQDATIVQDLNVTIVGYVFGNMEWDSLEDGWYWDTVTIRGEIRHFRDPTTLPHLAEDYQTAKITKQMWLEAKQRNGNMNVSMNKQFTKADMKDGMRFVLRNGDVHYWCEDFDCPMVDDIDVYDKELITNELINFHGGTHLDIMEVYALGELVWKRVEETEQEKKLKELRETIAKAEQQIKEIIGEK